MAEQGPQFDPRDLLDAYLDDQLTAAQRARFEESLSHDPSLQDAISRQREIDRSLSRLFVARSDAADATLARLAPPLHAGNGRTLKIQPAEQPQRRFVRMPLAIAAAIVFFICGPLVVWNAWDYFHKPAIENLATPKPVQPLDVAYRSEVANGFSCDWECKTQNEFASYFAAGFGQPLRMHDAPAQVTSIGLKYAGGITPKTISYMAKIDGQPVMVFTDRIDADAGQTLADPQGLHIFKRTIDKLVLYEVTPLDQPKLLELFYQP